MREHLDTLPVWDAYMAGGECPLCTLRARTEQRYVESALGGAVMEPAARIESNQKGYCARHFAQMMDERHQNRLGVSLLTHTHLKDVTADVRRALVDAQAGGGLFARGDNLAAATKRIEARLSTCAICDKLADAMRLYAHTLVHLWATDEAFRETFAASQGLCLPDLALVLRAADRHLSGKQRGAFLAALAEHMDQNLTRIEQELEWATLKYDYRNQDKPWGNSKDALERAVVKLRGQG